MGVYLSGMHLKAAQMTAVYNSMSADELILVRI